MGVRQCVVACLPQTLLQLQYQYIALHAFVLSPQRRSRRVFRFGPTRADAGVLAA